MLRYVMDTLPLFLTWLSNQLNINLPFATKYEAQLYIQDIMTLHKSQFRIDNFSHPHSYMQFANTANRLLDQDETGTKYSSTCNHVICANFYMMSNVNKMSGKDIRVLILEFDLQFKLIKMECRKEWSLHSVIHTFHQFPPDSTSLILSTKTDHVP